MGILLGDEKHPFLADGVNEKGLACAGLNFPDYVHYASNTTWCGQTLAPSSHGLGAFGLPGDYSAISRFVRIAFLKSLMPPPHDLKRGICEFYHLLGAVAMPNGCIIKPPNQYEYTLYTSCMCLERGTYTYTSYTNQRISSIDMHKEDLNSTEIKAFDFLDAEELHYQN